ncbi:hypothetical protein ASA1KI_15330 [Opitutales bacterium ASA1]|uniref:hypothetical protein n=1 Tax=Congregicoccus parvus TaxID=3081749 RepID=UPI002B299648|nr:hypothetical protein ASA1KI_15330 [Opitutales bacterium ASA1]
MTHRIDLCPENTAAADLLRPEKNDRSGIGVYYVDEWLKPLKSLTLPDGTRLTAKRRGLKITLTLGDRKGEGLMRRLDVGRDPAAMLRAALEEAARPLDARLVAEEGRVLLERE